MTTDLPLDRALHLRYFKRCLGFLPHYYTGNDSTRMTFGCFILASIDLLSLPTDSLTKPLLTSTDRLNYRQWVLSCQHPRGGFCGGPTHVLPKHHQQQQTDSGNANIAATSFALLLLALLSENDGKEAFTSVDRARTLSWLRRLQRADGSFGENLVELPDGNYTKRGHVIAGGRDMRYCYLAATVRWMLRGNVKEGEPGWVEDIDVDALVGHIRQGQTYDGGIAESSSHESHSGYGYCAVAALSLLDRPAEGTGGLGAIHESKMVREGISDIPALISFLLSRQSAYVESADEDEDDEQDDPNTASLSEVSNLTLSDTDPEFIGFNGRCNKHLDTCYCWWVGASLLILQPEKKHNILLPTASAQRRFLLERTQHDVAGGFSKYPSGPPDVYHAYLGLAALATMGEPSLKKFDFSLCISEDVVKKIESGRRSLLQATCKSETDEPQKTLLDMAVLAGGGETPKWMQIS